MTSSDQAIAPLVQSCTICHKTSRYKCPRCAARTCSADCSKRHKTLSMCSGERDPTKFLRSEELKTPEAFKNDFDLITSIEKELEDAHRRLKAVQAPSCAKTATAQSSLQQPQHPVRQAHEHRAHRNYARRGRASTARWYKNRSHTKPIPKPG